MNLVGGCLCGRVRYELASQPGALIYCHCQQCRKAQGVGFAANTPVDAHAFNITRGRDLLSSYRASARKARYFCSVCGSALYSQLDASGQIRIRAGTLDTDPGLKASAHIFCDPPVAWIDLADDLPRYAGREPGRK